MYEQPSVIISLIVLGYTATRCLAYTVSNVDNRITFGFIALLYLVMMGHVIDLSYRLLFDITYTIPKSIIWTIVRPPWMISWSLLWLVVSGVLLLACWSLVWLWHRKTWLWRPIKWLWHRKAWFWRPIKWVWHGIKWVYHRINESRRLQNTELSTIQAADSAADDAPVTSPDDATGPSAVQTFDSATVDASNPATVEASDSATDEASGPPVGDRPAAHDWRILILPTLVILLLICVRPYLATRWQPGSVEVTITDPPAGTEKRIIKGDSLDVAGTSAPFAMIALAVRSESDDRWWIQPTAEADKDGKWRVTATIGKPRPDGEVFTLVAYASSDPMYQETLTGRYLMSGDVLRSAPLWTSSKAALVWKLE